MYMVIMLSVMLYKILTEFGSHKNKFGKHPVQNGSIALQKHNPFYNNNHVNHVYIQYFIILEKSHFVCLPFPFF